MLNFVFCIFYHNKKSKSPPFFLSLAFFVICFYTHTYIIYIKYVRVWYVVFMDGNTLAPRCTLLAHLFSPAVARALSCVQVCHPAAAGLHDTVNILLFVPVFLCRLRKVAWPYGCLCRHSSVRELTSHGAALDQEGTEASKSLLLWLRPLILRVLTLQRAPSGIKPQPPTEVTSLVTQPGRMDGGPALPPPLFTLLSWGVTSQIRLPVCTVALTPVFPRSSGKTQANNLHAWSSLLCEGIYLRLSV